MNKYTKETTNTSTDVETRSPDDVLPGGPPRPSSASRCFTVQSQLLDIWHNYTSVHKELAGGHMPAVRGLAKAQDWVAFLHRQDGDLQLARPSIIQCDGSSFYVIQSVCLLPRFA